MSDDKDPPDHFHALRQARAIPGGHTGAESRARARRRSRLRLRRAGHLFEVPGHARLRRVSETWCHRGRGRRCPTWNKVEERYKSKRGLIDGRRLGCQARIQGDVVIDVPEESQVHKQVVRKRAESREIVMDPATKLFYVEVAEPDMHNPKGDLERLLDALWEQWQLANIIGDLRTLQMLQPALREGGWKVTVAIYTGRGRSDGRIMQVWPGFYEGSLYGVAIRCRLDHDCLPSVRSGHWRGQGVLGTDEPSDPPSVRI